MIILILYYQIQVLDEFQFYTIQESNNKITMKFSSMKIAFFFIGLLLRALYTQKKQKQSRLKLDLLIKGTAL